MKNVKFIYLYLFSGVLFLIVSGAYYGTEDSHLTPVFVSIGFGMISISFVLLHLLTRSKNCNSKKSKVEEPAKQ
jgi:hypothetical protein